ncbi:flavin-containing monooxygenase 5-like [Gigantopelta aegis]|uniref:flavin-containing monooxygenase 5-like n=1 Tax=Gigantopelta aegis TaxID=1735272 RepID=UPI001B88D866|nr:flavin-containing monooxygenase 5-like [Gigantopelta aegis]
MVKRVAVIGGGASGLTCIKCCLDEDLEPVCFERSDEIGGLWRFTEDVGHDLGCVMRSTTINTSKEIMCFSDFPMPKECPNFMHNTQVWEYFKLYSKTFGLEKYIRYSTEVLSVKPMSDFQTSGQWEIIVRDILTNQVTKHVFDAVLVCTGHHARKHQPVFAGQEDFQGRVLHSVEYKDSRGFEGKRVVIIGIGNSGGDAAVELSRTCSKVFLSTRRGSWVFNRVGPNGVPVDMVVATRMTNYMKTIMPYSMLNKTVKKQINSRFDHRLYCLEPKHEVFSQHPMVNDELPNRILSGTLTVKADVKRFTRTGLEFVDGTSEDDIDAVILATGYVIGFPFVDKSVIDIQNNRVELFMYMFPPDLAKPTLAVIGCVQPIGSTIPIAEIQGRLATRVFKGDVTLPDENAMWQDIRDKENAMAKQYIKCQRHTIQVDYITIMDQIAELNGCKPSVASMLLSDPKLAMACWFGPCTPVQYRLTGPGKWSGAREAIMTQWDRMRYPLQTRPVPERPDQGKGPLPLKLAILVVVLGVLYVVFF